MASSAIIDLPHQMKFSEMSFEDENDDTYLVSDSDPNSSVDFSEDVSLDQITFKDGYLALSEKDTTEETSTEESGTEETDFVKSGSVNTASLKTISRTSDSNTSDSSTSDSITTPSLWTKYEVPRKLFHSFHGLVTLAIYAMGISQYDGAKVVWTLFTIVLANDIIRLNFPAFNEVVIPYVEPFMREHERDLWNGTLFYAAGVGLVLSFAHRDIAVVSILLLSWADTTASTFGRAFGKYTPMVRQGKSLAGCIASALTGVFVCYFFYLYFVPSFVESNQQWELLWTPESSKLSIHSYAFLMGVIASVSEAVAIGGIDDNLTIPVLCSIFLTLSLKAAQHLD